MVINKTRAAAITLMAMLFVQIPLTHSTASKSHINVYHILLLLMPMLYLPAFFCQTTGEEQVRP